MSDPVETLLREHLASVDHVEIDTPTVVAADARRWERRRQRRHRALVGMACVTVIGLAGLGAANWPSDHQTVVPATNPPVTNTPATSTAMASSTDAWSTIPADPRGTVTGTTVVWTGNEAVAVGGFSNDGRPLQDHAAYDPSTRSWRLLASPPEEIAPVDPIVAWTGERILVVGGTWPDDAATTAADDQPTGMVAYDPRTDTWETLTSPPTAQVDARAPWAWTGQQLLVWPTRAPNPSGDAGTVPPLAYDPMADVWSALPMPPLSERYDAGSVWTGAEWIIWGGGHDTDEFADGARYDPATGAWTAMADTPLEARRITAVWTGEEMAVLAGWSGGTDARPTTFAHSNGAAYDPATDSWRSLRATFGHPGFQPVWTGDHVVLFAKGSALVYDLDTETTIDTCCRDATGGGMNSNPVWTGTTVILLATGLPDIGGLTFTPPAGP